MSNQVFSNETTRYDLVNSNQAIYSFVGQQTVTTGVVLQPLFSSSIKTIPEVSYDTLTRRLNILKDGLYTVYYQLHFSTGNLVGYRASHINVTTAGVFPVQNQVSNQQLSAAGIDDGHQTFSSFVSLKLLKNDYLTFAAYEKSGANLPIEGTDTSFPTEIIITRIG